MLSNVSGELNLSANATTGGMFDRHTYHRRVQDQVAVRTSWSLPNPHELAGLFFNCNSMKPLNPAIVLIENIYLVPEHPLMEVIHSVLSLRSGSLPTNVSATLMKFEVVKSAQTSFVLLRFPTDHDSLVLKVQPVPHQRKVAYRTSTGQFTRF